MYVRYLQQAYINIDSGLEAKSRAPAWNPAGTATEASSGWARATLWAAEVKSPAIHVTKYSPMAITTRPTMNERRTLPLVNGSIITKT